MRILVVHNRYQLKGGEDGVVQAESELLRRKGHEVEFLKEDNDGIVGRTSAVQTGLRCIYSATSARQFRERVDEGIIGVTTAVLTSVRLLLSFIVF